MTADLSGMSFDGDPVQDSRAIRRDALMPIVQRLQSVLRELEDYVGDAEYDDEGRRGD